MREEWLFEEKRLDTVNEPIQKKDNEFATGKKRPKLKPIGGAQEKQARLAKAVVNQQSQPMMSILRIGRSSLLPLRKRVGATTMVRSAMATLMKTRALRFLGTLT